MFNELQLQGNLIHDYICNSKVTFNVILSEVSDCKDKTEW